MILGFMIGIDSAITGKLNQLRVLMESGKREPGSLQITAMSYPVDRVTEVDSEGIEAVTLKRKPGRDDVVVAFSADRIEDVEFMEPVAQIYSSYEEVVALTDYLAQIPHYKEQKGG